MSLLLVRVVVGDGAGRVINGDVVIVVVLNAVVVLGVVAVGCFKIFAVIMIVGVVVIVPCFWVC